MNNNQSRRRNNGISNRVLIIYYIFVAIFTLILSLFNLDNLQISLTKPLELFVFGFLFFMMSFAFADFVCKGYEGMVNKKMVAYRWFWVFTEHALIGESEPEFGEKWIVGGRAQLIGFIYFLFGLIAMFLSTIFLLLTLNFLFPNLITTYKHLI